MAYTAWAASTGFAVGDVRRATSSQNSGLVFECTTAGTSGSSEPTWPTDISSTVTDGTVVWTAISSIYADLSTLAPDAIIELFELHYDSTLHGSSDILRWHAGSNADVTGNITWDSNDYSRLPVKADGFEYSSSGQLPRQTISCMRCEMTLRWQNVSCWGGSVHADDAGMPCSNDSIKTIEIGFCAGDQTSAVLTIQKRCDANATSARV